MDDTVLRLGHIHSSTYAKLIMTTLLLAFIIQCPLGDPCKHAAHRKFYRRPHQMKIDYVCEVYNLFLNIAQIVLEMFREITKLTFEVLHQIKIKFYKFLAVVDGRDLCHYACGNQSVSGIKLSDAKELTKDEVDKVIEDDITSKLSEDLLQSIERKFQVDLERSVDMVLVKIKLLLQNGTTHIQDGLVELQGMLDIMRQQTGGQVDECLKGKQNVTSAMAEKALHQMVVCGYALIGQDPSHAISRVVDLKNMIKQGVKPIHSKKKEIDQMLKICGHEHDSLKNVIKCVISKSPTIKTSMMEITGKLIEGVVQLTKLMAHGAMHEACLIEVVKTLEDDAFEVISSLKDCAYGNSSYNDDVNNHLAENNATVLNIEKKIKTVDAPENLNESDTREMKELLRRMVMEDKKKEIDNKLKQKILQLHDNKLDETNDVAGRT